MLSLARENHVHENLKYIITLPSDYYILLHQSLDFHKLHIDAAYYAHMFILLAGRVLKMHGVKRQQVSGVLPLGQQVSREADFGRLHLLTAGA